MHTLVQAAWGMYMQESDMPSSGAIKQQTRATYKLLDVLHVFYTVYLLARMYVCKNINGTWLVPDMSGG